MKRIYFSILTLLALFLSLSVQAQEGNANLGNISGVNVFLDAKGIDVTFLKEEITQVNYVNTRDAANVHLLSTKEQTGSGSAYHFFFIGLKEFEGKNDTLNYYSSSTETQSEIRDGYTSAIKMGLIRYMALNEQYTKLSFESQGGMKPMNQNTKEIDKWDSWVFETDISGRVSGEQTSKSKSFTGSFDASRVTKEWRYEFIFSNMSSEDVFETADFSVKTTTIARSFNTLIVNSLGEHMAVGLLGGASKSTINNYDIQYTISPAFEYNFYPYSMSSRRQLKLSYYAGFDSRQYADSTIFNKLSESLLYEKLALGYKSQEEWGNVYATAAFKHFMRDINEYNFSVTAGLNVRIWKGLSWNMSGSYSKYNDQINLSKATVSLDQLLLGSRQLATDSSYRFSMGLSFTFGSSFNNVVNPRLKDQMSSGSGMMGGGGMMPSGGSGSMGGF